MPYRSVTYIVLIASPGDMPDDRDRATKAINDWNDLHAEDMGVTLQAKRWETSATPEQGDRPQGIINKQLVTKADLLIGMFWTRMGTHTGVAESGTVEEIEEVEKAGKPVMLYFSELPVPPSAIRIDQLQRLSEFKSQARANGLSSSYTSLDDLYQKLMTDLTRRVRMMKQADKVDGKAGVVRAAQADARLKTWSAFNAAMQASQFRDIEAGSLLGIALMPVNPPAKKLDLRQIRQDQTTSFLLPPLGSMRGWNTEAYGRSYVTHNALGAKGRREARGPTTVAELTDAGVIYAADHLHLSKSDDEESEVIYFEGDEHNLFKAAASYIKLLRLCGIEGAIECRVILTWVIGTQILPNRQPFRPRAVRRIESQHVELDPITINPSVDGSSTRVVAEAMRDSFDILWLDAGLSRDPWFNPDGSFSSPHE